ncbi:hypothetical protein R1sor_010736 [Riccia sorocarpa]|uniref:Expansin-like EG45 domain-containing protein n=1 Tax=Riccia sorocarpa TaxID=122646 RepID=A0ABD3HYW1_9MARC
MNSRGRNLLPLLVLAVVSRVLAASSSTQQYEESNGTFTSSQTSSCFGSNYNEWGLERSLAVGVSPAIFKVGANGSPNACGVTMEIKCLSGPCVSRNLVLQVKVVDLCKNCDDRTIRLTLSAYNQLASIEGGDVILGYR